jgi:hypothetical protein
VYQSTFVRYERRGDRVVPVRVTKSWVTSEGRTGTPGRRAFMTTRVSELRRMPKPDHSEAPPEWPADERVETRERLMTLLAKDAPEGECLVREAGYDRRWLPYSAPCESAHRWTLDNGNGWLENRPHYRPQTPVWRSVEQELASMNAAENLLRSPGQITGESAKKRAKRWQVA